jgi:iron complex outermembrane receptor protein
MKVPFTLCFGMMHLFLFGQNTVSDTASIPAVVVRSTLVRDTLRNIPASVAVLDRALLRQNDGTSITSLINQVPGVYMQQGALNTNRITIRGIGARSQYSTNRVKAYIDGIPISTAAGSTVIEDIDMDVLESVEIIKGPASSIYGTGLGGVINLYTHDKPASKVAAVTSLGSFGLQKHMFSAGLNGKKATAQVTYNQLQRNGYRDNASYDRKSLTVNGKYHFSESTTLSLLAILTRMKAYIPSSVGRSVFESAPTRANANWEAAQGFESYDKLIAGLSLGHRISEALCSTTSIFIQLLDAYEPRPFDILAEARTGAGARTQLNLDHSLFGKAAQPC